MKHLDWRIAPQEQSLEPPDDAEVKGEIMDEREVAEDTFAHCEKCGEDFPAEAVDETTPCPTCGCWGTSVMLEEPK